MTKNNSKNYFAIFPVVVTRVQKISEHFIRVSLAGSSLHRLSEQAGDGSKNLYDAYIKLLIPPPGSNSYTDIELTEDWRNQWFAQAEAERGWMRTYTIRAHRLIDIHKLPEGDATFTKATAFSDELEEKRSGELQVPEIDLDFVLHHDSDGKLGPGAKWAQDASVGSLISFMGPLRNKEENNTSPLWTSWRGSQAQRLILAVDETAVPAACSILTSVSPAQQVDVIMEVPADSDCLNPEQAQLAGILENLSQARLHWLPRASSNGQLARGEALAVKLRELLGVNETGQDALNDEAEEPFIWDISDGQGDYYAFIAGEAGIVRYLRRICINEAGLDKANVSFMGYWKEGRAEC